ncbi:MAG: methyltransferase domain-containing protein, partial [Leptonema sp. (in: Bacteria)]|nr:methyltransferase domain-containing protein [Leptonema sp. (in: bacteria)]
MNTAHFDTMSITWDENPNRMKMADNHVAALRSKLKLDKSMHLLDYGCGTGLVLLRLLPFVGSVIGLDTSKGMVDQFQKKVEVNSIPNCKVGIFNPAIDLLPIDENSVDVIVSTMAFHHIPEIEVV